MRFLETIGEEFCVIRRKEDILALDHSLQCLDQVVAKGSEGYTVQGRECRDIGYLLELGLVRQDEPLPEDLSTIRYYPTSKGVEVSQQVSEKFGKKGNK